MKKGIIVKLILSAILIIVGVFGLVYNVVIVYNGDLKYLSYKSVESTVTSVQSMYADGNTYYQAVFSYDIGGVSYTHNSDYTTDDSKYIIGATSIVRYDPNNPNSSFLMEDGVIFNYLYLGISCIILTIGIKFFDKYFRM